MHWIALAFAAILAGCHNTCQDLCKEMATLAESDTCQYTLSDGELRECIRNHTRDQLADGDLDVCEEFADTVQQEWTCDDLQPYFPTGSSNTDE
jgi:hypothetical protein